MRFLYALFITDQICMNVRQNLKISNDVVSLNEIFREKVDFHEKIFGGKNFKKKNFGKKPFSYEKECFEKKKITKKFFSGNYSRKNFPLGKKL